ncbi:MAG: hypothetical protein ACI85F_001210 [Bacteroidia bacterium]|jgi:hypothetical protein
MIPAIVHTFVTMRHVTLAITLFLFASNQLLAQEVTAQQDSVAAPKDTVAVPIKSVSDQLADRSFDDRGILLKQEFTGGIMLHSQGWGINLRRSKNKTFKRKRVIELDVVSVTHPKEIKIPGSGNESFQSYVYGRTFQVLMTRLGYGRQNTLYERFDKGLEIRYLYIVGFSAAWAKPVYLEIIDRNDQTGRVESVRYDYDNPLHRKDNILGASSFFKGFEKMVIHPGLYGKVGISFDYAKKQRSISTIEAGVIVDAYFDVVEQMAVARNNQVFVNLYISLNFGAKWYK